MIRDEWTVLPLPPPSEEYRENYDSIFRKKGRPVHEEKVYKETIAECAKRLGLPRLSQEQYEANLREIERLSK